MNNQAGGIRWVELMLTIAVAFLGTLTTSRQDGQPYNDPALLLPASYAALVACQAFLRTARNEEEPTDPAPLMGTQGGAQGGTQQGTPGGRTRGSKKGKRQATIVEDIPPAAGRYEITPPRGEDRTPGTPSGAADAGFRAPDDLSAPAGDSQLASLGGAAGAADAKRAG